jgi:signal transduction histidine kinase
MGPATLTTGAFAALAFCVAVFNFWLFWVRRTERTHLWLAVSALGILCIAAGTAALYESQTLEQAQRSQLLSLCGAVPLVIGFLRFTSVFTDLHITWLERAAGVYTALVVALMLAVPSLLFDGSSIAAELHPVGQRYVEARLAASGAVVLPGFLAMFVALIVIFWRRRRHLDSPGLLFAAVVLWAGCAANDASIAAGWHRGPYLVSLGFAGFAVAFTAVLLGRFVASMARVERNEQLLKRLVDERSQALREKDLQLAHGSRLATVGALSEGLAREIDAPVHSVAAQLNQLAEAHKDPNRAAELEELLNGVRGGVDEIRGIVSQLLRLARRVSGDESAIQPEQVVQSVLAVVRHEVRSRARLETDLAPVQRVRGDEGALAQVILNLVMGAMRAIPPGTPAGHRIRVSTRMESPFVVLTVSDTGSRIPEDGLGRVFDPFYLEEGGTRGTALALAITHQLVSRNRGQIGVESSDDETVFTVKLPAWRESR